MNSSVVITPRLQPASTSRPSKISRVTSSALPTSSVRSISVSIRLAVPREETRRTYRHATAGRAALLLHPDDEEAMERGRYPLSEEGATSTQHIEPRRSCPPHRLGPDSISSHCVDDPLWHQGTARRVDSLAKPRYRQPTNGHTCRKAPKMR